MFAGRAEASWAGAPSGVAVAGAAIPVAGAGWAAGAGAAVCCGWAVGSGVAVVGALVAQAEASVRNKPAAVLERRRSMENPR